jgi:cytochrome c
VRWTLALLLATACAGPARAADGAQLFNDLCASCHATTAASSAQGPSLKGVVWRKVASRPDFAYSKTLVTLGGSWSPDRLDSYLKDSQAFSPGNGMYFTVEDANDRKAIIGYLKTAH